MVAQVPPIGPIKGMLVARDGAWAADGQHCVSCGDRLRPSRTQIGPFDYTLRCPPCHQAAWIAIDLGRREFGARNTD
jgi:hypothetical protein